MSNMKNHEDDDEMTTTKTACKRIQLSDGAIVWITDNRLGRLYQGLPVLQYLLEGHPGMTKPRPQGDNLYDFGLDEAFGIPQQEWSLLVGFFSPARLPPTTPADWDRLKRAANVLGSSDDVDKAYLLDVQNRMVRPSDDRQEVFEWASAIVGAEVNSGLNSHGQHWLRTKMADGFVLVNDGSNASLGRKQPGEPYWQHFRKRKRQPQQEDATAENVTAAT
jgi:hypothetical protein